MTIDQILEVARSGGPAAMVRAIAQAVEEADTLNKRERLAANLKAFAENLTKHFASPDVTDQVSPTMIGDAEAEGAHTD